MLSRRFVASTLSNSITQSCAAIAAAVTVSGARFSGVKSNDPTYEDDRWLEAELSMDAEMTQEERYAKQKQAELMKKILKKSREDAQKHVAEHTEAQKQQIDSHKDEIADLKKQMAELSAKLAQASK